MKTTHHKLISLLIAFVFFACAGVKKTEKTTVKETIKTETELYKKTDEVQAQKVISKTETANNKSIEEIEKKTENFETRLITYDTEKPVNEATGKPPVKSETITTYKKAAQKNTEIADNSKKINSTQSNLSSSTKTKINAKSKEKDKVVSKTETTEKPTFSWLKWLLIGISIPIVIGIIYKVRKWILAFPL